jgi:serine/threonine-protein kinase
MPDNSEEQTPEPGVPDLVQILPPTVLESTDVRRPDQTSEPPLGVPVSFGRFEQLQPLPPSGMADVFKARDPVLQIDVALKVMKSSLSNTRAEEAERFFRDARALARLDHPNIVRVHDVGIHDGRAYFTMGFITGGSLQRHAARFADPRAAAEVVGKVARAMHYVHGQGVLHRDLKPANILLDDRGEPRVSDFSLAKFRDDDLEITREGVVMGTIPYMAPEQTRGQVDRYGPATDVWAMGVVLYELLTRRRPFEAKSREAIASLICGQEPPPPRVARADVDRVLEAIVLKCLEKKPEDRYATAAALADDLGAWLEGRPTLARPPSRWQRLLRFLHRHRRAAAVAGLLVGLFLLLWLWPARASKRGAGEQEDVEKQGREVLKEARSQLERGTPVDLIPPAGLPKWYRRRVEKETSFGRADFPGADLRVSNFKSGLVELLPESPRSGYRLKAEVMIANDAKGAAAGICVACREWQAPDGVVEQWWINLAFPYTVAIPRARLTLHRYHPGGGKNTFETPLDLVQHDLVGGPWTRSWRALAIEVRPDEIGAFWEGNRVGAVGLDRLGRGIAILSDIHTELPAQGRPTAAWLLGGSPGLYNEQADTAFRNIVVEPIE